MLSFLLGSNTSNALEYIIINAENNRFFDCNRRTQDAIHSTKFPEHFHPPFEVDHFSHSDRSEILVEWIAPSIFIIFGWYTDCLYFLSFVLPMLFREKVISCEVLHIKHVSKSATQLDYCIKVCSSWYRGSVNKLTLVF